MYKIKLEIFAVKKKQARKIRTHKLFRFTVISLVSLYF